jgi:16S rRNA (cytosine967-C5)-methyltransferase
MHDKTPAPPRSARPSSTRPDGRPCRTPEGTPPQGAPAGQPAVGANRRAGVQDARQAALRLLEGVLGQHRPLIELTAQAGLLAPLDPPQRAEAQRLALACLRRLGPVDAALAPLLRRSPEPALRAILRLAASEIATAPEAAHAAVHAAVEIARSLPGGAGKTGFVNAVLRKLAGGADLRALPPQRLPPTLRQPMLAAWGEAAVAACEAVHADDAVPLDITLRDARRASEWAAQLDATILPTGSLRRARAGQVSALPGHAEGAWWVQDAAAALPVHCLAQAVGDTAGPAAGAAAGSVPDGPAAPWPGSGAMLRGLRVLDMCAAPGGKTLQLAALGAEVTALDASAPRMQRLAENLARTGLRARCVTADALEWQPDGPFDAIVLDAPCSASGTIRRHPDLPFLRSAQEIAALVALQSRLIDRAAAWMRPGGWLVYATCSVLPAEGEAQIAGALGRIAGLRAQPLALPPGLPPEARTPEGALRILPMHWAGRGGIDGFFIAALRLA